MERNRKIQIYCLFAASLFLGIFGAVCLYLGIIGEYNDAMGHFNVDSVFAPVVYVCLVAGPVLGLVGWILLKNNSAPDRTLPDDGVCGIIMKAVSCLTAALILFTTVTDITDSMNAAPGTVHGATVLSWVFSALAAASLIVNAVAIKTQKTPAWASLLSFSCVFFCASRVLLLYFDQSVAVNSPIKFICQLCYLSFMLVFTAEIGLSLGRGNIYPRYMFALCTAMAIGGTGALGALVATVTGAQCAAIVGNDCYLKAGLFLYVCTRFILSARIETSYTKKEKKKTAKDAVEAEEPAEIQVSDEEE